MASDNSGPAERGVARLSETVRQEPVLRSKVISPLAKLDVVGHEAADAAANALGLSRRQV